MGKKGNKKRKHMIAPPVPPLVDWRKGFQELAKRDNLRTPDFLDLKLEPLSFVFVYGTLKSGGRLTDWMDDCPFLGEGTTALSSYQMRISDAGEFPVLFDTNEPAKGHRAAGEVYVVDAKKILELDAVEANGEMFIRQQRWIWLEDQKGIPGKPNLKPCEKCWVYLGNPTFWQGRLVSDVEPTKYGGGSLLQYKESTKVKPEEHPLSNVLEMWKGIDQKRMLDDAIPF